MARKAKWTPGPWEASADGIWATSPWNARVRIATVTHFASMNGIDSVANSYLIALAPELYYALANITECAAAGDGGANMDLWIEQARDILAKASGQPHA